MTIAKEQRIEGYKKILQGISNAAKEKNVENGEELLIQQIFTGGMLQIKDMWEERKDFDVVSKKIIEVIDQTIEINEAARQLRGDYDTTIK